MELKNKTVLFLGSSVTFGSASGGVSFVEMLGEACGIVCVKEAVSGTTLADINERSYLSRLKALDIDTKVDLFVCQLSTNDATKGIEESKIEAAIREIVELVEQRFGCPIVFYTGTYFASEAYEKMIALLYGLQGEYGFAVLDLFHDAEMTGIDAERYRAYMKDPIHPTLLGYREWWTPKFVEFLNRLESACK